MPGEGGGGRAGARGGSATGGGAFNGFRTNSPYLKAF